MKPKKSNPIQKPYTPPTLHKYGDFKRLTLGQRQTRREAGGTSSNKTRITMAT